MGCICSKGISANENVLKQPNKSSKQLFCTSGRDDITVSPLTFSRNTGDKKNVVSEKSDLHVAQRPGQIDTKGNVGVVYQCRSYGICSIQNRVQQNAGTGWPTAVTRLANKEWLSSMPDLIDKMFKGDYLQSASTLIFKKRVKYFSSSDISRGRSLPSGSIFHFFLMNEEQSCLADDISLLFFQLYEGGVFTLIFLESVLLIEMYVWDTDMPELRKTYSRSIGLKDTHTSWHHQKKIRVSKSTNSLDNKMDGFFLDLLNEDVSGDEFQKRTDVACLYALAKEVWPYNTNVTGKKYPWFYSFLNQCNIPIPIHDAAFLSCAPLCNFFPALSQMLGQAIKTKLTSARNARYLPELTSFQASDSNFLSYGSQYTREDLQQLLRMHDLPICKTVNGKDKNLRMKDLCMMASTTSLNPYKYNETLLVRFLAVSKFQEKKILVRFEETPSEQEDILVYLYMNWQDLQQDSSVIEALKETKFVTSADGGLYKPTDLFDPGDALLTSVFSGEVLKFPGERFFSTRWLNILRKTGLRNTGDPDVILECARRVEFLGSESMKHVGIVDDNKQDISNMKTEVSLEIWSLAETLIKAIIEKFSFLYDNNFCNLFGKIACIPAEIGFLSESGKKGVKRVLCSYSEAILLKDWPLAWTTAPVLCRESLVPPDYSWGALQLRSPPRFTTVITHLQAEVCPESSLFNVEDASFEVLKYLDTIWDSLSSSDILELQKVAFIAADNGTHLVSPSSLFTRMTINLSPLASNLPSRYMPFVKILKELGVEEMLSSSGAMNILSRLHESCGYYHLNPNELRAVINILHFLCNEIIEQQKSDTSNWESNLVVPDDACRLAHSNLCVYNDLYGSQYVRYIDSSKLRFVHQDVSEKLCLAFGIRKLSDVVVEEIDRIENLQTLEEIGSVSLATIRLKLLSRSFQVAVSSVVNNSSRITSGYTNPDFLSLQRSLKSVAERLQFVKCIYTRFWLLPKSLDITRVSKESVYPEEESGNCHRSLYYVDRSNTRMLIAEPPSYVSVLDLVAIVVSHVLGSPVPLPISSLFLCPQDSEPALVNILKLSSDTKFMDGVGGGTDFLGRDIVPEDAKKVLLTPLRTFYKGEIVAWKSQNGEKLKYGRIHEDVRPSTGKELSSVKIETFPGKTKTFLSSHVLWFRYFENYRSLTQVMLEKSGTEMLRNQRQAIKELEHGRVSAEEFVQAVGEMLSGAGIRMDTKKQCLLKTTLSLQERLNESQAALVLEQERSEMKTKEADAAKEALLCRICLTNEIDITLVPCGHVLCHPCSSAVSCCPICRVHLSKTMNLYRP